MNGVVRIEISFPVAIDLTSDEQRAIDAALSAICRRYEREHPGRVMWPFGFGCKMLVNPLALSDDQPIPFDDSVYAIEIAEREDYAWPCAKCGKEQGDHKGCITNPPAGACDFEPQPRELAKTEGTA